MDYVHYAETNRGLNDNPVALHSRCREVGGSNEFGYDPFTNYFGFQGKCFDTFEDSRETVVRWFTQKLDSGMDPKTCLCLYNTGRAVADCPYAQAF